MKKKIKFYLLVGLILALTLLYTSGAVIMTIIMRHFCSGAFQINLRDPRFWHNLYLMLRIYALELRNLDGVPQKIRAWFLKQGSKSKMKFLNTLQSCNIIVGDILQFMGILKPKLSISQKGRVIRTKINVQKVL